MNKKGGADMWWIIIGAVLALTVLVVLVFMFTGNTDRVNVGLNACYGGECVPSCSGSVNKAVECPVQGEVCCIVNKKTDTDKK